MVKEFNVMDYYIGNYKIIYSSSIKEKIIEEYISYKYKIRKFLKFKYKKENFILKTRNPLKYIDKSYHFLLSVFN